MSELIIPIPSIPEPSGLHLIQKYKSNELLKKALYDNFLQYIPHYLNYPVPNDCKEIHEGVRYRLGFIDGAYRLYLTGLPKTLHWIMYDIRELKRCRMYDKSFLKEMMSRTESDILDNELYELMPRHLKAKQKILILSLKKNADIFL